MTRERLAYGWLCVRYLFAEAVYQIALVGTGLVMWVWLQFSPDKDDAIVRQRRK